MGWAQAICNPTSVTACLNADDNGTVYVDGFLMGTFGLAQGTNPVSCITSSNAGLLSTLSSTPNNVIGVYNQNTKASVMLAAWAVQINCSSGAVIDLSTDSGNIKVWDNGGSGSLTPPGTGTNWYDPTFTPSGAWANPDPVASSVLSSQGDVPVTDEYTGAYPPFLSYDPSANAPDANWDEFFRQTFTLVIPTPLPTPDITITKSLIGGPSMVNQGVPVTYGLKVCNTGKGLLGPVTVVDPYDSKFGVNYDGTIYQAEQANGVT
ncbi:MAG: hypothetical protein ACREL1_03260, partial [bacterium]